MCVEVKKQRKLAQPSVLPVERLNEETKEPRLYRARKNKRSWNDGGEEQRPGTKGDMNSAIKHNTETTDHNKYPFM